MNAESAVEGEQLSLAERARLSELVKRGFRAEQDEDRARAEQVFREQQRRLMDWKTLAEGEPRPREWIDDGWLGIDVSIAAGIGGAGKTQLLQQGASCWALGRTFLGSVSRPRNVLMWNCEDDHDELWRRQQCIARWLDVDISEFAGRFFLDERLGKENTLFTFELDRAMFTHLREELVEQANDYKAEVVILDNVAQLFAANENNRHHVTKFVNGLRGCLPGRAVVLVAHPSRQAGSEYSGNSAWENAVRMRWYLGNRLPDQKPDEEEEPADDVRFLSKRKANYSAKDWRRFTYQNGVLVPDAIEAASPLVDGLRKHKAERVVLDGVRTLHSRGVHVTDGKTSQQFLPRALCDYKLNEGCTRPELANAMRQAVIDGRLIKGVVGTYSNRAPRPGLIVAE